MKFKVTFFLALVFFCIYGRVFAETKFLHIDLKKGDTSAEVKTLQEVLNKDPLTRVASTGPGSPGYETMYFGTLTEAAVKKFQEKYKWEIFSLSGTPQATGQIDIKTRTKINDLLVSGYLADNNMVATPAPTPQVENSSSLRITSISPENVVPGETLNIYGTGFTKYTSVYFGDKKKVSFEYVNSGHIKIKALDTGNPNGFGSRMVYIRDYRGDTRWTSPVFAFVTDKKIKSSSSTKLKNLLKDIEKANDGYTMVATKTSEEDKKLLSWNSVINFVKDAWSEISPIPQRALAANNYFGGEIREIIDDCSCPHNYQIILKIEDKASSQTIKVAYKPNTSKLHSNYNISNVGVNVLGGTNYQQYTCKMENDDGGCDNTNDRADTTIDSIRGVGTSKF